MHKHSQYITLIWPTDNHTIIYNYCWRKECRPNVCMSSTIDYLQKRRLRQPILRTRQNKCLLIVQRTEYEDWQDKKKIKWSKLLLIMSIKYVQASVGILRIKLIFYIIMKTCFLCKKLFHNSKNTNLIWKIFLLLFSYLNTYFDKLV